jgi:hypothetical protein
MEFAARAICSTAATGALHTAAWPCRADAEQLAMVRSAGLGEFAAENDRMGAIEVRAPS